MRRDWLQRSPRKVWGTGRTGLLFPGPLADKGQRGYLFVAALKGAGHRTELCRVCGNITGLDGLPLRCLHPSQAGSLLDGTAAGLTGFLDADATKPASSLAAGGRGAVLNVKQHTHIHITPEKPPCQVNPGLRWIEFHYEYVLITILTSKPRQTIPPLRKERDPRSPGQRDTQPGRQLAAR